MSLRVDWCSYEAAKFSVKNWHYSRSLPASKLVKVGVWEDGSFVGCVIFSRGACNRLLRPFGLSQTEGCELTRVALSGHKAPVSRILRVAVKLLKRKCPGMRIVVSFADPAQGHHGGIYQASGWVFLGATQPCKYPLMSGRMMHPRSVGCRQKDGAYIDRSSLVWVLKPGKYRYAVGLDPETRAMLAARAKPYPKRASEAGDGPSPGEQRQGGTDPDAPDIKVAAVAPRPQVCSPSARVADPCSRRRPRSG